MYLALDQGTTSSRSILFSDQGEILACAQEDFSQPGCVERCLERIWQWPLAAASRAPSVTGVRVSEVKAIGIAIQRVWVKSILLTQYAKNSFLGLDGADYMFSVSYGFDRTIYGKTWSPSAAVPRALVSFGDELYRYTTNPKKPMNETELIERLRDWETKIPDKI